MRKFTLILWVLGFGSSAFAGISRSELAGKFDLDYEKAALSTVLSDISTFSSQNFVFKKSDLSSVLVTMKAEGVALKSTLDTLLAEHSFEFENLGMGILAIRPKARVEREELLEPVAPVEVLEEVEEVELADIPEVPEIESEAGGVEGEEVAAISGVIDENDLVMDRLIERLEDPELAMTVAQFQKRYVTWLQAEGFSIDQAVELVRSTRAAELLIQAEM